MPRVSIESSSEFSGSEEDELESEPSSAEVPIGNQAMQALVDGEGSSEDEDDDSYDESYDDDIDAWDDDDMAAPAPVAVVAPPVALAPVAQPAPDLLGIAQQFLATADAEHQALTTIARSTRAIAALQRRQGAYGALLVRRHDSTNAVEIGSLRARKFVKEKRLGVRGRAAFWQQIAARTALHQAAIDAARGLLRHQLADLPTGQIDAVRSRLDRDRKRYQRVIDRELARAHAVASFPRLLHSYRGLAKPGASIEVDASISLGVDVLETVLTAVGHGVPVPSSLLASLDLDLTLSVTGKVATGDDTKIRPSLTFALAGGAGADLTLAGVAAEAALSFGKGEAYDDIDHFVAHYMKTLALIVRRVSAARLRALGRMEESGKTDDAEAQVRNEAVMRVPGVNAPGEIESGSAEYARIQALQQRKPGKSTVLGFEAAADGEDLTGLLKAGISAGAKVKHFTRYINPDAFALANPGQGRRRKLRKKGYSVEASINAQVGPFKVTLTWERISGDANQDNDGNYLTMTIGGAAALFASLLSGEPVEEEEVEEEEVEEAAGEEGAEAPGTETPLPEGENAPVADDAESAVNDAEPAANEQQAQDGEQQDDEEAVTDDTAAADEEEQVEPPVEPSRVQVLADSIMGAFEAAKVSLGGLADIDLGSILGGVLGVAIPTNLPFGVTAGITGSSTLQYTWSNPSVIPLRKKWRLLFNRWLGSRGAEVGVDHLHLYGGITAGAKLGISKTRVLRESFGTNTLEYLKAQYLGMKKHERFEASWARLVQRHRPELQTLFTRMCDPSTHAHREAVEMNLEVGAEVIPLNFDDPAGADFNTMLVGIRSAFDHEHFLRSSLNAGLLQSRYGWKPSKRTTRPA
jgi:hypothetical protein